MPIPMALLSSTGSICRCRRPRSRSWTGAFCIPTLPTTTVHVWDGRFFRLNLHLDRFFGGLEKLRMTIPFDRGGVAEILHNCVALSGHRAAYVEMLCTRGASPTSQPRPAPGRSTASWLLRSLRLGRQCRATAQRPPCRDQRQGAHSAGLDRPLDQELPLARSRSRPLRCL
ncbi:aminotransferase class IV [Mesorhizobium atlanticum]